MRRMFLLFWGLFVPLEAYTVDCNLSDSACSSTPGCYVGDYGCQECDDDDYCTSGTNFSCSSATNNVFPNSASGARSKYECYREVPCTQSDGETTNSACREYYRDGTGTTVTDSTANITYKGNSNHHWVSCDGNVGANDSPNETEAYHMESNNSVCYADKLTCKAFSAYAGNSNGTLLNCSSTTEYLVYKTNTSVWQNDDQTRCTCNIGDTELYDNSNPNYPVYICTTTETVYTQPVTGVIIDPQQTVEGTKVYYHSQPSNWSCAACKAGYVGFFKYANNDNRQKCVPAMKGCYSDGCNGGNCVSSSNNPGGTIPCVTNGTDIWADLYPVLSRFYHPCYAGMTTDSPGATGPGACRYTDETKFCDAYGCFQLTGTDSSDQNSIDYWNWFMETSQIQDATPGNEHLIVD